MLKCPSGHLYMPSGGSDMLFATFPMNPSSLLCSASVLSKLLQWAGNSVNPITYRALGTVNGGEVVSSDAY